MRDGSPAFRFTQKIALPWNTPTNEEVVGLRPTRSSPAQSGTAPGTHAGEFWCHRLPDRGKLVRMNNAPRSVVTVRRDRMASGPAGRGSQGLRFAMARSHVAH